MQGSCLFVHRNAQGRFLVYDLSVGSHLVFRKLALVDLHAERVVLPALQGKNDMKCSQLDAVCFVTAQISFVSGAQVPVHRHFQLNQANL